MSRQPGARPGHETAEPAAHTPDGARATAATVVAAAAGLHLAAAVLLAGLVVVSADPLAGGVHAAGVFIALAAPAVLALMGLWGRWPLVLAAALSSAVLSIVPFSVHSFVMAPLAAVYAGGYLANPTRRRLSGWRTAGVLVVLPLLGVVTFVAPTWISNPLCYQQTSDGDIAYYRAPGPVSTDEVLTGDVVRGGCTSKAPDVRDSGISTAGLAAMIALGLTLPRRRAMPRIRRPGHRAAVGLSLPLLLALTGCALTAQPLSSCEQVARAERLVVAEQELACGPGGWDHEIMAGVLEAELQARTEATAVELGFNEHLVRNTLAVLILRFQSSRN